MRLVIPLAFLLATSGCVVAPFQCTEYFAKYAWHQAGLYEKIPPEGKYGNYEVNTITSNSSTVDKEPGISLYARRNGSQLFQVRSVDGPVDMDMAKAELKKMFEELQLGAAPNPLFTSSRLRCG